MKKFLGALALVLGLAAPAFATDYGIPDDIQKSNILHCFDWTFNDIKTELPNIAAAGFGAIQVSPVQGNASTNAEWFYAYMPYDFVFKSNGNGNYIALKQLCEAAAQYNIKIIVDVVANHINQAHANHDCWWDDNGRIRWNGYVNYGSRYSITHGQLGEYGDVNSESAEIQQRCITFLETLKSYGVKGIRWDAAKHIGLPSESCAWWSKMAAVAGLWQYGEILDGPGGDKYKLLKEYTGYIGVTDSEYSSWTRNQVCGNNVPSGSGSWTANGVPADRVVLWGESHDEYANDGQYGTNTAYIAQDKIDRAYAIVACRDKETALYFSRPSATTRNTIKMGQKGSTHFTSKEIAEVNKFRNKMSGTADYFTASNGVVCVTRKGGGAVIVIGSGGSKSVSVSNGGGYVPAGTYKDQVSGNTFTVTASTITGTVGSTGIAVVYNPDGTVNPDPVNPDPVNPPTPPTPPTPTDDVSIYVDGWSNVYAYVYKDNNGGEVKAWPGNAMTKDSDTGYWKYTVPADYATGSLVIINTNGGPNRYPADMAPGMPLEGKSMIFHTANNSWEEYNGGNVNPTPGPGPDPNSGTLANMWILGNLGAAGWGSTPGTGVQMYVSGSTYTATGVEFKAEGTNTMCWFNITDYMGSTWDDLNAGANRYGAAAENDPVTAGSTVNIVKYAKDVNASGCNSWTIAPGKYNIEANLSTMKLTVSSYTPSGLTELEADEDAPVEYFNLQGLRVENPTRGMYIRRQGSRSSRVYIR